VFCVPGRGWRRCGPGAAPPGGNGVPRPARLRGDLPDGRAGIRLGRPDCTTARFCPLRGWRATWPV